MHSWIKFHGCIYKAVPRQTRTRLGFAIITGPLVELEFFLRYTEYIHESQFHDFCFSAERLSNGEFPRFYQIKTN